MDLPLGEQAAVFVGRLFSPGSWVELAVIMSAVLSGWYLSRTIKARLAPGDQGQSPSSAARWGGLESLLSSFVCFVILALLLLLAPVVAVDTPLLRASFYLCLGILFLGATRLLISSGPARLIVRLLGLLFAALYVLRLTDEIVAALEAVAFELGGFRLTAYGVLRLIVFAVLIFWLGRMSNKAGKIFIRKQNKLDYRTRELLAKLFELSLFFVGLLLLLQVMGINLTAIAVFGGALGIGLGFGLQAIASNFASGLIILLDRSVSIGDFVELEDGRSGTVVQQNLRSTMLETFEARYIVVPNEKFITTTFTNWTHKDAKQRYRVDFSVAYDTDVRHMVELVKAAVAEHPSVLSGEDLPFEERPDCEIDSFGDSGINMFVEFWMEGIDDGRNRVGGDLLLIILETLQQNGIQIPFPQREVRILKDEP